MTDWRPDKLARRLPFLQARARIQGGAAPVVRARKASSRSRRRSCRWRPAPRCISQGFATDWETPDGEEEQVRWLHSSPEFAMKKLWPAACRSSSSSPACSATARARRCIIPSSPCSNGIAPGRATRRSWTIARRCSALTGARELSWEDKVCDPEATPERLTVAEAFERYAGVDVLAAVGDAEKLAQASGIAMHAGDTWDDVFFRVMFAKIEPRLGMGRPTILCEYPISMAALARAKPGDPRVAERFELYACGVELANAFGELTDPAIQRARLRADMDEKERLYGLRWPVDPDFLAALDHGLPQCSGLRWASTVW